MALGARCGALHDIHMIDDVRVERGAHLGQGHAPVELAATGRDYSDGGPLFEYYPPPLVHSVEPPCGPVEGSTVVIIRGDGLERLSRNRGGRGGAALDVADGTSEQPTLARNADSASSHDADYRCGWGACDCTLRTFCTCANITVARWDSALRALVCSSPLWLGAASNTSGGPLQHALTVSLNGQDFSPANHTFWRYVHPPRGARLLQLEPMSGPVKSTTDRPTVHPPQPTIGTLVISSSRRCWGGRRSAAR
jgi:hypothetical protein